MKRILKFQKNDCTPCTSVSQYLDQKGINYETINAFDEPEKAIVYKVRTVPTVIVLDKDTEVKRIIGFKPEELALISQL